MIYTFKCECGYERSVSAQISVGPPARVKCVECGKHMNRDWQTDAPMLDTSRCKDANEVAPRARVRSHFDGHKSAERVEHEFKQHIDGRRKELKEGGNRGSIRQTHSVPAHLYHGKIKETGDQNYWQDPANLNRHTDCKVGE